MQSIKKWFLALLVAVMSNCSQDLALNESSHEPSVAPNIITSINISDPTQDPYTLENMQLALLTTVSQKTGVPLARIDANAYTLEPNFLYVRFLAEGKQGEYELRNYDTNLVMFKHPMDYKPIAKPAIYKDPTLPDSVVPYFATVPVSYVFGTTKYEVLKELFLVEPLDGDCEDDNCETDANVSPKMLLKMGNANQNALRKLQNHAISLQEVERTSLQMTGNLSQARFANDGLNDQKTLQKSSANGIYSWSLPGSTWKPKGTLKFKDDHLGDQPLVGVRVIGGYSYYWRESHTDKNGYFEIPEKWSFSIDYELNFDNSQFLLEDGHSVYGEDLEIEKNNKKSAWNETFTGNKAKWCVVWTAAYQYWHGEIYGLKRPRQNAWWNQSLDIAVYYKNDKDYVKDVGPKIDGNYSYSPITEWIGIRAYNQASLDIYATTIHEIAHSSHYWNMKTTDLLKPQSLEFFNLPKLLKETYTSGIEWYLTNKRYKNNWQPEYGVFYTGLFEDLIDNDGIVALPNSKVVETVSGFTVSQLEAALFKVKTWDSFRKELEKAYPSSKTGPKYTQASLLQIFNFWGNLK